MAIVVSFVETDDSRSGLVRPGTIVVWMRCRFTPRLVDGPCRRHVFDMTIGAL
jgi:hypothetical protein